MNEVAKKTLDDLTEEEFESIKEARIKMLTADTLDLETEVKRNWLQITLQDYVFNSFELSAKVTKEITKSDLQEFFNSLINPSTMRKLSLQTIGNEVNHDSSDSAISVRNMKVEFLSSKTSEAENLVTNIEDFQNELFLYPVAKFEI